MSKQIVVLGAGYAGLIASIRLAGKLRSSDVRITLINASSDFVERVRLHQVVTGQKIKKHLIENYIRGKMINFVQGWITAIDPDCREVYVKTDDCEKTFSYDNLIYALGSYTDRSPVIGAEEFGYSLDSDSVNQLRVHLPSVVSKKGSVSVIGGGLTGIEVATELAENFPELQVSLLTRGRLGDRFSAKGQTYIRQTFSKLGIIVYENVTVTQIEKNAVQLDDDRMIVGDICLWTAGFAVPQIAKCAGFAVNESGQILVDAEMRSISHPEIYAVGDSATFVTEVGLNIRMACATAMPMGVHAVDNLVARYRGESAKPFAFGYVLQCVSLGRHEGLVQWVNSKDEPKERIITGRLGAWIKEAIVRGTVMTPYWERLFPGIYSFWSKAIKGNPSNHHNQAERINSWNNSNNIAQ